MSWKFEEGTEGIKAQEKSLTPWMHNGDVGVHVLTFHSIKDVDGTLTIEMVTEPMPEEVQNPEYNNCRVFTKRVFDSEGAKKRLVKQLALIGDYSEKRKEIDEAFKSKNLVEKLDELLKNVKLAYILQVKEYISTNGQPKGWLDWASYEFEGSFCRPVARGNELTELVKKYPDKLHIKVTPPDTTSRANPSMNEELAQTDDLV